MWFYFCHLPIFLFFYVHSGKSVLNQKSELKKVMEKRLDNQKKQEAEKERLDRRSSFERKLDEQASKLKISTTDDVEDQKNTQNSRISPSGQQRPPSRPGSVGDGRVGCDDGEPEFLKIHAKLRHNSSNNNHKVTLDNHVQ